MHGVQRARSLGAHRTAAAALAYAGEYRMRTRFATASARVAAYSLCAKYTPHLLFLPGRSLHRSSIWSPTQPTTHLTKMSEAPDTPPPKRPKHDAVLHEPCSRCSWAVDGQLVFVMARIHILQRSSPVLWCAHPMQLVKANFFSTRDLGTTY
mgnify:CR=1 FL=1